MNEKRGDKFFIVQFTSCKCRNAPLTDTPEFTDKARVKMTAFAGKCECIVMHISIHL